MICYIVNSTSLLTINIEFSNLRQKIRGWRAGFGGENGNMHFNCRRAGWFHKKPAWYYPKIGDKVRIDPCASNWAYGLFLLIKCMTWPCGWKQSPSTPEQPTRNWNWWQRGQWSPFFSSQPVKLRANENTLHWKKDYWTFYLVAWALCLLWTTMLHIYMLHDWIEAFHYIGLISKDFTQLMTVVHSNQEEGNASFSLFLSNNMVTCSVSWTSTGTIKIAGAVESPSTTCCASGFHLLPNLLSFFTYL